MDFMFNILNVLLLFLNVLLIPFHYLISFRYLYMILKKINYSCTFIKIVINDIKL